MAEVFQVSVSELLGVSDNKQKTVLIEQAATEQGETEKITSVELAEKLEQLNSELAERIERERILTEAGKVRGCILMLAFAAVILVGVIKNTVGAIVAMTACCIAALLILYNNLSLMTSITTEDYKLKPLKITTIFNITMIAVCAVIALLVQVDISLI